MAAPDRQTTPITSLSRQLSIAIVLLSLLASSALLAIGDPGLWEEGAGTQALALGLLAGASLPLLMCRRAPLAVFVATALAQSALQLVATPVGPPVGPTVALFWLAYSGDGSRGRTRATLAVVAAMLAVHALAIGIADGGLIAPGSLLFGLAFWGATWLAGDRARLRGERMAELEERALRAEREAERERSLAAAEERYRIARDLHDSAGHAINVILVHAGSGRLAADHDPAAAREAFATIEEVARETVGEIDQMVGGLRENGERANPVEAPLGLASLGSLVAHHRAAGFAVAIEIEGDPARLSAAVDRAAYRIVQEALTNAARHGEGEVRAGVAIGPRELTLTITNPVGAGAVSEGRGGHGLVGMRERARQLGGSVAVEREAGRFRLVARIPLPIGQQ